jgi:hypothetical protein
MSYGKYTVNPLSVLKNSVGLGLSDLFQYKAGVKILSADDTFYNKMLVNGGIENLKEYRLSKKAKHVPPSGIPIADRWVEFTNSENNDIYLVESPILTLNRQKIINKTNVYGYDGTVKEYIGLSDWNIDMTFFIFGKRRFELEYGELSEFLDIFNANGAIPVNSPLLNYVYGITDVVCENISSIQEHTSYKNVLQVNITMSSDEDYEPFSAQ